MDRIFESLAKFLAILGGAIVVAITLVTTYSIAGRWLFNSPLLGDTEVVEYGMAIVVACFLPICQWRGENIIVDFFTTRASQRTRDRLDRIGALLVALMLGMISWRTGLGAISQKSAGSTTMLMQIPDWYAYAFMSGPLAIAALMALYTAITGRNGSHGGPPTHNPVPESATQQEA